MLHDSYSLNIDPVRFMDAYNLDIGQYVERHTFKESAQKTGKQIFYMSYSHAFRLFRTYFPELQVANRINPETGSFIFEEIGGRGFFLKPYVYRIDDETDRKYESPDYYYPVLTVSGLSIYPNELAVKKDYSTGKSGPVPGQYVADIQLFNKSVQRGLVKAMALTTGIGLKLWTGDDLDETIVDEKFLYLEKIADLARQYNATNPEVPYVVKNNHLDTLTAITSEGQTLRKLVDALKNATVNVSAVTTETIIVSSKEQAALPASKSNPTKSPK
jgi:hypothetical protein